MRSPAFRAFLPARVPITYGTDNRVDGRLGAVINSLATKPRRFWDVTPKGITKGVQIAESMARRMRPRMTITMEGVSYWHLIEQHKATKLETGIWLKVTNNGIEWFVTDAEERPITDPKAGRIEIDMSTLPEEK